MDLTRVPWAQQGSSGPNEGLVDPTKANEVCIKVTVTT